MPSYNNIGKAIYNILANNGPVAAIVSTRIFPNKSEPNAAFPFIIYQTESTLPNNTKDGASITDAIELDISIFATTYSEATDLGEKVREALDYVAAGTYNTINLQSISFENEDNDYDSDIMPHGVYLKTQTYNCRVIFS